MKKIASIVASLIVVLSFVLVPMYTKAVATVVVDTINGLPPSDHCIAGPLTFVVHGVTGQQGGNYSIDLGNGLSTTTIAAASGGNTAFSNKTINYTPSGSSNKIIINLYHSQPSGNDSNISVVNLCVAPPTTAVLTLKKNVVNDNAGVANAGNFTLHLKDSISGNDVTSIGNGVISPFSGSTNGVDFIINPGTYTISEDSFSGYTLTGITGTGCLPNGNITVSAGSNYTCTLTNDDNLPPPDTTAPVISQVTPVPTLTNDATPNYTFTTNEAGTITYGGSCSSVTTSAVLGSNTITFNTLADGTYPNCTITVTDTAPAHNVSNILAVNTFTIDTTPPIITLNGSTPVSVEAGSTYTDAGATATESAPVITSGSVNLNVVGAYVLTYNATDAAGNTATPITRTVNVVDTTAPVITLLGSSELTIEAGSVYSDAGSNVIDNVDVSLVADVTGSVDTNTLGDYVLAFNATDNAGNDAIEVTRTVHVVDTTAPVIILNGGNESLHTGDTYSEQGATATDNLDDSVEVIITGTVDTDEPGTYTLHYNATDSEGNHAIEVTRTVTVVDVSIPIITLIGNGTIPVEVGSTYSDEGATAEDDVDGDLTESIITVNEVNTSVVGSYTVTYNVSDSSSNAAVEIVRTVNVVDTTDPIITVIGDNPINLKVGDTYTELGATATDNYDGDLTSSIIITGSVNTAVAGTYTITYTVTDANDNTSFATRDVVVRNLGTDSSLVELSTSAGILTPVFDEETLSYTVLLPFGTTENPTVYATTTDEFATKEITQISDITSGNVADRTATVVITSELTGEGQSQTTYTVVFSVSPFVDTEAPVITLIGDSNIDLNVGETYTEQGATVTDNFDSGLEVVITGEVDVNTAGTYTLHYNATDNAGNHATEVTRTVTVSSPSAPSSGGGGSSGSRPRTSGQVLGASTDIGESASCVAFLQNYMRKNLKNDPSDVTKLQEFLNENLGTTIPLTGFFGPITEKAVEAFQLKYADEILTPWVAAGLHPSKNIPTGYVYKTTLRWINLLKCSTLDLPIPILQ